MIQSNLLLYYKNAETENDRNASQSSKKLEDYFLLHVLIYKLEIAYNGLRIKKRIKNKHFCQQTRM